MENKSPHLMKFQYHSTAELNAFVCKNLAEYGLSFVLSCEVTEDAMSLFPWIPKESWTPLGEDGGAEGTLFMPSRIDFLRVLVCFGLAHKTLEQMQEGTELKYQPFGPDGKYIDLDTLFEESGPVVQEVVAATARAIQARIENPKATGN